MLHTNTPRRFASVSYGKPLTIEDDDCTVEMPADFPESPHFIPDICGEKQPTIVYSTYQRELNKLYQLATPALRKVFSTPSEQSHTDLQTGGYSSLVEETTQKLFHWRSRLPSHLLLNLECDYHYDSEDWPASALVLQSISLQITFDNLLMVLYRPFMATLVNGLCSQLPSTPTGPIVDQVSGNVIPMLKLSYDDVKSCQPSAGSQDGAWRRIVSSSQQCFHAALRTARLTELSGLVGLAAESHIVTFMAMNLFSAGVVLIALALQNPLSQSFACVKSTVTRIFKLQELLSIHSMLAGQTSTILKTSVLILHHREMEALLGPQNLMAGEETASPKVQSHQNDSPWYGFSKQAELPQEAPIHTELSAGSETHSALGINHWTVATESVTQLQEGKLHHSVSFRSGPLLKYSIRYSTSTERRYLRISDGCSSGGQWGQWCISVHVR